MSDVFDWEQLSGHMRALGLSEDQLPALREAVSYTANALTKMRSTQPSSWPAGVGVIAFGSIARYEATPASDLDCLVVDGRDQTLPSHIDTKAVIEDLRTASGLAGAGATGIFGSEPVQAIEICARIGLQDDTNHNTTRRVLLLEESVPVFGGETHANLMREILDRYLALRAPQAKKVPRVLLNDIVRYWRTVAVDYHAKSVQGGTPYSLRYLKLLISRKLCYVAALAPLYQLELRRPGADDEVDFLVDAYRRPPLLRLVEMLCHVSQDDPELRETAGRTVLALEQFLERTRDPHWRKTVQEECKGDMSSALEFPKMREVGKRLHEDIGAVLTSERMFDFTREYMLA